MSEKMSQAELLDNAITSEVVATTEITESGYISPETLIQLEGIRREGEPLNLTDVSDNDWKNLVFIRKTQYAPQLIENDIKVPTAYEATRDMPEAEVVARLTSHWTVNEAVTEHPAGDDWRSFGFTIFCPGESLVELNGEPININPVDTYWNHGLSLPEGTVIIHKGEQPIAENLLEDRGITLISLRDKEDESAVISKVIEKMGYTIVELGTHYSQTEGFNEVITEIAKRNNIANELHAGSSLLEAQLDSFLYPELAPGEYNLMELIQNFGIGDNADRLILNKIVQKIAEEMIFTSEDEDMGTDEEVNNRLDSQAYQVILEAIGNEDMGIPSDLPMEVRRFMLENLGPKALEIFIKDQKLSYEGEGLDPKEFSGHVETQMKLIMGEDYTGSWVSLLS